MVLWIRQELSLPFHISFSRSICILFDRSISTCARVISTCTLSTHIISRDLSWRHTIRNHVTFFGGFWHIFFFIWHMLIMGTKLFFWYRPHYFWCSDIFLALFLGKKVIFCGIFLPQRLFDHQNFGSSLANVSAMSILHQHSCHPFNLCLDLPSVFCSYLEHMDSILCKQDIIEKLVSSPYCGIGIFQF